MERPFYEGDRRAREHFFFFWVVKKESGCLERESTLLLRSSFYRGKDKNSGEENLEEKENQRKERKPEVSSWILKVF